MTALSWLVAGQIVNCGSLTIGYLAAMRYIAARPGHKAIRLQAAYSAVAMGGGIAIVTMAFGVLYRIGKAACFG